MVKRALIIGAAAAALAGGAVVAKRQRGPTASCETRDANGKAVQLGDLTADECIEAADTYAKRRSKAAGTP